MPVVEGETTAEAPMRNLRCMEVWGGNTFVDTGVVLAGLDAWIYSKPQEGEEGGDVHYVSSCAAGMLTRLLVADVRGHGTAAADSAQALRQLMRSYINRYEQARFMSAMNRTFAARTKDGAFATAVVTSFIATTGELRVSNAGHPPPLWYRVSDGTWTYLEAPAHLSRDEEVHDDRRLSNVPLGIVSRAQYRTFDVHLSVGDIVICYTDAISESRNPDGELLGRDGLLELVRTLPIGDPREIVSSLLQRIDQMDPQNLQRDDVTVLVFRPNGLGPKSPMRAQLLAPLRYMQAVLRGK